MGHINKKPHIIAVVGPTASGKSELAVQIAKQVNGEIVSCDSRQVYRGMDIGSGKVPGEWSVSKKSEGTKQQHYVYKSIPHFGIDIASPKRQYSAAQFQKYAQRIIKDILSRNKIPVLCGGTGLWVDAVVSDTVFPAVKPNAILRKKLEKQSVEELFAMLKKKDPTRAETIDRKNPRRLIRALEIVLSTGKPVPEVISATPYSVSWIGITKPEKILHQKIKRRLEQRLNQGMIKEVTTLQRSGISWARLESFGLEYKYCALILQKKISQVEFEQQLFVAIKQYAKRQMTWFKRNKDIHWVSNFPQALSEIKK